MTGRRIVVIALSVALGLASVLAFDPGKVSSMDAQQLPNNLPHPNPGGKAATFSTQGNVDLTGEFFQAQGTNGRSCASCHIAEEAWSINLARYKTSSMKPVELIRSSTCSTQTIQTWTSRHLRRGSLLTA